MALSAAEQEVISARITKLRDDIVEQFFTAFGNAGVKFDAEGIQREIIADLTKERRTLALKMIGFTDRWGKLEVDGCNGRISMASEFIKNNAEQAVQKWVEECLRPTIEARSRDKLNDTAVMKAIMKEFNNCFMNAARAHMEALAEAAGREFATTLANQLKAGIKLAQEQS